MRDKAVPGTRECRVCHTRGSFEVMARYGDGRAYGHHACLLKKYGLGALDMVSALELMGWPVDTLTGLVPLPEVFMQKKIAEKEEAAKATAPGFGDAIRRGVAAAETEDRSAKAARAAATGLDAMRAAVAAFEEACDAVERAGVVPRPSSDGPLAAAPPPAGRKSLGKRARLSACSRSGHVVPTR